MKSPIQRQMELFSAALEHPAGPERDAFLAQACAGDHALLDCIRTLLAGHSQAGSFLGKPVGPVGPTGTHLLPSTEKLGDKIGRYKLLQQIGEGGCGTVYMAEQEEPVRRRVALKVIRLGMDTKTVIARFEAERQALALMDHPNIAKVFDGGATESSRPYFVMELVRGIKITEYCDQAHLSTGERLHLFIQVCQAVQHAHQKGIIHRDIKPSNILVTVNDGVAVPKVIDFGIAKATDQRLTDKTYFTEFHAFIGTPAYTSPEQAEMSSLDIDTRSDIYSLGVLLYELLTSQTPFPAERLLHSGLDEMRRIIREEEPPRPSTRLTTLGLADATVLSQKRQAKIPQLASAVQGDLDWIVMKALEKDRTRRYATSLDFAADLQRHLNNEAVLARPPSLAYKFQRTVRRNKGAFAAAAAVFLALLTGLGLTAWQAVRASRAEHAARAQSEQARTDRNRAVLAESNATDKATEATNALLTANERMVKLNVAEGWRRVEEGDHFGALLPFAEAFALEQDKPDRAETHQMRLASVLQHCPKLVNVWSVGTNINHAEFSRDGQRVIITRKLGETSYVELSAIYDAVSGRVLFGPSGPDEGRRAQFITWSGDETRIAAVSYVVGRFIDDAGRTTTMYHPDSHNVQIWDIESARPVAPPVFAETNSSSSLYAFLNADGTRLWAYMYGDLSLRDVATGNILWRQLKSSSPVDEPSQPVTISKDGRYLVTQTGILDAESGRSVAAITNVTSAEFSSDGARLFMIEGRKHSPRGAAVLRDGSDPARIVNDWKQGSMPHVGRFSRDGKKLATANSDSSVRIWSAADGSPLTSPMEHAGLVSDLCFSSDGAWLATGTGAYVEKGYAQVWDASSGTPITPQLPHDGPVLRVSFNKDNTQLLVVGDNGAIAIWSLQTMDLPRFTWPVSDLGCVNREPATRVSADGATLAAQSESGSTRAWNLRDGGLILPPVKVRGSVVAVDTNLILESFPEWTLLNLKDGKQITRSLSTYIESADGKLSSNGRWLTAHRRDGTNLLVIDAVSGLIVANLECPRRIVSTPGIRSDGKQVATFIDWGDLLIWNLPSTVPLMPRDRNVAPELEYSLAGGWLIGKGSPFWIRDTLAFRDSGVPINIDYFYGISPNDAWALYVVDWPLVRGRVQNLTNSAIPPIFLKHRGEIQDASFSPDSRMVMSAGSDSLIRFLRIPDGEAALLPIRVLSPAEEIAATGDGRGFVTTHYDDTLRYWELPKGQRPVSDWLALARFFAKGRGEQESGRSAAVPSRSGSELADASETSKSATRSVAAAAGDSRAPGQSFHAQWLALRAKHPEVFTVSADEIDAWHRHEAWRCESRQDWSNAVVHLSALLETHPDSGDFLPRRAVAHVAWAEKLVESKAELRVETLPPAVPPLSTQTTLNFTNLLERALADYTRTLAWVDRFPAIAKESRKPFVEKRREVYLKLGRKSEAEADERELKAGVQK